MLPAFLQAIRDRAAQFGWEDIFQITIGNDAAGNALTRDLLTQYGEITLENVRNDAALDYIGQQVRNAQALHQIYLCLKESFNNDVTECMVTESDNYHVDGTADGQIFLMTLIQMFFIRTEAEPSQIRLSVADAYNLIQELEYNIDTFNTMINAYVRKLSANGHTTKDLFTHLTRAYKVVPYKGFKQYITICIDQHNNHTNRLTPTELMQAAKSKYDEMVKAGEWMK